jgi:catechol 2,3-dioxygenase-like lactoylglutathione lyase family enzyme
LNVSDLHTSVAFYTSLFGVGPAKVRPGYANFAVADPPLKLVLIESGSARGAGLQGALNHVGVEVESTEQVAQAMGRLSGEGLTTTEEHQTTCCYAVQDKVWVSDPDQTPWEIYAVLEDAPAGAGSCGDTSSICCQLQEASTSSGCC